MNQAALVETLRPLPRTARVRLDAQIDRLSRICGDNQPLELFLEEVLDVLRRLFGAAAGGFWLRCGDPAQLQPTARVGFGELPFSAGQIATFDRPIETLARCEEPVVTYFDELPAAMLVAPMCGERNRGSDDGSGQTLGLFQLVITDLAEGWEADCNSRSAGYRLALRSVLAALQPEMVRRLRAPSVTVEQAHEGLQRLGQQINGIQRSIRIAIERHLHQHSGAVFGGFDENQQFVRSVQKLLDAHGLRVRCPECGHAAILRCSRNGAGRPGLFVFDHYLPEGRTFHGGGATLPTLRLMSKPTRRKSSAAG